MIKLHKAPLTKRQKNTFNFYNGTFQETFNALVTSNGTTVTMSLEQSGTGDLTMRFSDGYSVLDCTPALTVVLTIGSDSSPQENFVYILMSDKILTVSTSAWPTAEHIKIAYFLVPTAVFVQNNGVYVNQNWNDHRMSTNSMGHMAHMAERSRRDGAYYFSGVDGNGTNGYLTPTASNVELKSTAGVIYQMHRHTIPAFDTSGGDSVLIKNWSGDPYHDITNLFDITSDSTGASIGNNKWFNLVVWGVGNKSGEYAPMMINLPSGFYNTQNSAQNDVSGYDDFSIPREFNLESSTAFLIARITIKMGTTWSNITTVDLRGQTPSVASGGAAGIATDFPDNTFTVFNVTDNTKIIDFDAGSITTGNTRTITMADTAVDLADIVLNTTHRGSDGTDHSFIDQDVTTSSTPTFNGLSTGDNNITNVGDIALDSISSEDGVTDIRVLHDIQFQGDVESTGNFMWTIGNNNNAAFAVEDGVSQYWAIDTTTGGENMAFGNFSVGNNLNFGGDVFTFDVNTIDMSVRQLDVTLNASQDALNFDSDTLSIDADNHRVGFGISFPASTTHTLPKFTVSDSSSLAPFNITERSAEPSSPASEDVYLDDGTNTASGNPGWRRYTGAAWEDISAGAGGGGSGTMTTVKEDGVQLGGADIVTLDFLGADFDLTESPDTEVNIVINDAGIDHDATTNFVANEHIDHTGVTLTAGVGLSGGGTIASNRTFTVDLDELTTETTIASGDFITMVDITDSGSGKITFANFEGTLNHDSLTGFVSNEHIDHSTITLTAGVGLSGGGTIAANRTFTVDLNELTTETTIASGDFISMVDITDSGSGKITFANLEGTIDHASITNTHNLTTDIDHDALTNFVSGEHFLQSAITTVGTVATGVWEAIDVGVAHGGTGASTAQAAIDTLTAVSGATNEHVLTKDTGTGNAVFKAASGGGLSNIVEDTTPQLGGDLDLNGKNIDFPTTANVSDVKDEDDMATDSATMLATQQSIKAYVDARMPTGAISPYGAVTAPSGWLLCDGTAVSRTTYSDLFAIISTTYGVGDGSTTFNVPDLKSNFPAGYNSGDTKHDAMGETGGSQTHTLVSGEMPAHTHTQNAHTHTQNSHNHSQNSHSHVIQGKKNSAAGATVNHMKSNTSGANSDHSTNATTATNVAATATNQNTTATNQNTGGDGAHENMPPYITLQFIIKT